MGLYNPQFLMGLFIGPSDWKFQPGEYRLAITAPRAVGSVPLQGTFVVPFSEAAINSINSAEGARFGVFPSNRENTPKN